MRYYTLPAIGTGTIDDPFRPDLPDGTSWVGTPHDGSYLIATRSPIPPQTGRRERPDPTAEAARRGLAIADVRRWWVA